ncbi:MAG: chitobiase/beta-hexosaminidase C-terminal domain-containing protein, partial [Thermoguttaceae bacterium]
MRRLHLSTGLFLFPWMLVSCTGAFCLNHLAADGALGEPGTTYADVAQPHPRSAGAPRASDVCFSTRWPHPTSKSDPHDSFKSARQFHATRLDWLYLRDTLPDKQFVSEAKAKGYPVGGTLNCQLTDTLVGAATYQIGRTVNMKGQPLKDPWTMKGGMRWCCPNHPEYSRIFLAHARCALDAGVDYFQMDGVQLNAVMTRYGGCFCVHCVGGFRDYLAAHSTGAQRDLWGVTDLSRFDYAAFLLTLGTDPDATIGAWKGPKELRDLFLEFQVESGLRFLSRMYGEIDRMAGRDVAFACNANEEFLSTYHPIHDFALIEAYPDKEGSAAFLYEQRLKKALEIGKSYLMTFVCSDIEQYRRFIATAYALGANVIVPWDVFTGLDSPRFFGEPGRFADLFALVRANAMLLEGYEEAAVIGAGIRDSRYSEEDPPLSVYARSPVLAVVRARPGRPDAPVVVHFVAATGEKTGPLRLAFDPRRFFAGRPLRMRYVVPAPYDAEQHEKAEAAQDFSLLTRSIPVTGGRVGMVELPAVDPWGLLIVEPAEDAGTETPWQPAIWCDEKGRAGEVLDIRIDCATPGAEIRYTLDGSEPGRSAMRYEGPIRLKDSATVKARSFGIGGGESVTASARFERVSARPRLVPDAPTLRSHLRLWLRAGSLLDTLKDGDAVGTWPAIAGSPLTVPSARLLSGEAADAPKFGAAALNGRPAVRFDGVDD